MALTVATPPATVQSIKLKGMTRRKRTTHKWKSFQTAACLRITRPTTLTRALPPLSPHSARSPTTASRSVRSKVEESHSASDQQAREIIELSVDRLPMRHLG